MTDKKRVTYPISRKNYDKLTKLKNNNNLKGMPITKGYLVNLALDYFFIQLETEPLEKIFLKTLNKTEQATE